MNSQLNQEEMAVQPQSAFPFFQLPREIRDMIYSIVISSHPVTIRKYQREPRHCYGILMANKQTHSETLKLFYNITLFVIEETWARRGVEWLSALPDEYRGWIERVRFKRDLQSFGNMYSKLVYRAVSRQNQQAMLLEPFWRELKERGVELRDGVLRA